MNTTTFSIQGVFKEAWSLTKKNIWLFTTAFISYVLILFLIEYWFGMFDQLSIDPNENADVVLREMLANTFGIKAFICWILINALTAFFALGAMKMALNAKDGIEPSPADFANSPKKLLQYFLFNIIYSIIIFIGFTLCIFPGLLLMARLQFAMYFILEQDCNALEALSRSWDYTKGVTGKLILFTFFCLLMITIGLLCLFIGFFVAVPVVIVACALIYRKLVPDTSRHADFDVL